jgi:hypothetical protein
MPESRHGVCERVVMKCGASWSGRQVAREVVGELCKLQKEPSSAENK